MSGFSDRRRARILLGRAFDGTLDADGWLALEALAARDPRIAEEFARQQRLVEAFEALDEPEAEPFDADAFTAGVLARLDAEAGADVGTGPRSAGSHATGSLGDGSLARGVRLDGRRVVPFAVAVAAAAALLVLALWGPTSSGEAGDEELARGGADGPGGVARTGDGGDATAGSGAGAPGNGGPRPVGTELDGPGASDEGTGRTGVDGREVDAPREFELDARPLDPAEREARRAAVLVALADLPDADGTASWAREVRRTIDRASPGGATAALRDVLELALDPLVDPSERPAPALLRRAAAWLVEQRDARSLHLIEGRLASVDPDGSQHSNLRSTLRDGWITTASVDDVAGAVRDGWLGADDTRVVSRYLAQRSTGARAHFASSVVARGLHEVDPTLFATLCDELTEMAESTAAAVARGRVDSATLGAHRDNHALADALAAELADARRGATSERLVAACAVMGSRDALPQLAQLCRARRPGAAEAVVAIGGTEGIAVWLDVADELAVGDRVSGWRALIDDCSAPELLEVAASLEPADERRPRLLDGLVLADDPVVVPALVELATGDLEASPRRATVALDTAIELLARTPAPDLERIDLDERAFDRLADACGDVDLLARVLVAFHLSFGPDAARDWCLERFDDVRPMDAFDTGRPQSAATRARVRLFLERVLRDAARA